MTGERTRFPSFFLAVASMLVVGYSDPSHPPSPTETPNLPLLAPGNHVGMIVGFNPSMPPWTAAAVSGSFPAKARRVVAQRDTVVNAQPAPSGRGRLAPAC